MQAAICNFLPHCSDLKYTMRRHTQALLDAIPDLLFEVGFDGRIHDFHSPRTELLAMPAALFLGKLIAEVLPAQTAATCMGSIQRRHVQPGTADWHALV